MIAEADSRVVLPGWVSSLFIPDFTFRTQNKRSLGQKQPGSALYCAQGLCSNDDSKVEKCRTNVEGQTVEFFLNVSCDAAELLLL